MKKQVLDTFCGIGGMSLGFQRAGFSITAGIDWHRPHSEIFKKNFPQALVLTKDVKTCNENDFNYRFFDVIIGSSPCFGFNSFYSNIEKDERNKRILYFGRLVARLRPDYFVWETTTNLIKGKHRAFYREFLSVCKHNGYKTLKPRELVSSDYGGFSSRKRLYLIGYKSSFKKPSFPKKEVTKTTLIELIGDLENKLDNYLLHDSIEISPNIYARYQKLKEGKRDPISNYYRLKADQLSQDPGLIGEEGERGSNQKLIHYSQHRTLTRRELARIQGLPDSFVLSPQSYKNLAQICNSSCPLVIEKLGKSIGICYN